MAEERMRVAAGAENRRAPYDEALELREYLLIIRRWWWIIVAGTAIAVIVTFVVAKFALTRWYRAEAIIRPVARNAVHGRLSGLLSNFGGGGLAASVLGAGASNRANEYIPILKGFAFTTALIKRHNLEPHLIHDPGRVKISDPQWRMYRRMKRRFDCELSLRTGNITLHYQDPDRKSAAAILGYYVDDLREKLRRQQVQDAAEAVRSLKDEARVTADNLLQTQLYELLAGQIQQEKLAQVQADFAFTVLEPPAAPDKPFRPRVLLDCILAAILAGVGLTIIALLFDRGAGVLGPRAPR